MIHFTDKHKKFLVALRELLNEHEVDLILKESFTEQNTIDLCVVSDGVFDAIANIKYEVMVDGYICIKP